MKNEKHVAKSLVFEFLSRVTLLITFNILELWWYVRNQYDIHIGLIGPTLVLPSEYCKIFKNSFF